MFINFWYPAAQSGEITDKPVKRSMLGQDFVLFRDGAGKAQCLSDVCVHRGASLSTGKVKGDCVECPYHGWTFNGEGKCTRIPSLGPDAKIPSRARVDAYPVEERYGLVFAFLGDLPESERPPIMEIPEWDDEGWAFTIQHYIFDFDYKRSVENGIDPAHNEFVHTTHIATAEGENYVPELRFVDSEWGVGFYNTPPAPPLTNEKMRDVSGRHESAVVEVGTGHHGPAQVWTYIHPTPKISIHQYLYETPISEGQTSLFLVNMRNFMTEAENDEAFTERNEFVVMQDRDVLLNLRPVLTPRTNTKEILVPSDQCVSKYREFIKEWEGRGWRIDSDEIARNAGKVAYAVPSPARRNVKGWVLDAIPLESGESAAKIQTAAE